MQSHEITVIGNDVRELTDKIVNAMSQPDNAAISETTDPKKHFSEYVRLSDFIQIYALQNFIRHSVLPHLLKRKLSAMVLI